MRSLEERFPDCKSQGLIQLHKIMEESFLLGLVNISHVVEKNYKLQVSLNLSPERIVDLQYYRHTLEEVIDEIAKKLANSLKIQLAYLRKE